ncbi:hypothetical protein BT67DRAFT_68864 [Trichocladium antarcticum]|uniref:Uncharacterized protein n=1 Tax=Trichocladium antarcticum TaxID=1450529 RepID=A0AAN6UHI1_9PEZI|nr:hypothetical protein BT67DRAFT_68864 [Trichocladium antarcticum]
MRSRSGDSGNAAPSPAAGRELRPRQAPGSRYLPAGPPATPREGGRITRSSAVVAQTSNNNPPRTIHNPVKSHKRSGSPTITLSSRRAKRTRPQPGLYVEEDDSDSGADAVRISDSEVGTEVHRTTGPKTPSPRPARTTKHLFAPISAKKARLSKQHGSNTAVENENSVIPDWASLPYHVLTQVFRSGAASLEEGDRAKWLSAASSVCRAFAEPALTALYESPPLLSRSMAHGLVALLSKDPTTTTFKYRTKVEELWIGVEEIAAKSYRGQPLDLKILIGSLPRLQVVQFYHSKDDPPYRRLDDSMRWQYPAVFFEALNGEGGSGPAKLTEWQWNRRLMGPDLNLEGIARLHQTPSFSGLKKVSFVNYQTPSLHAKNNADDAEFAAKDQVFIQSMASAITALPNLEFLSIESSTAANGELLLLLPKSLKVLELVNCWEINGEDFASYLLTNGYNLKHLLLHHNQSLDLSFLTVLGTACPQLETLRVDFKTFNHHEFYKDSDPNYEDLLTASQIPTWPRTLKTLELKNMRKWTAEAAETLFESLIDSAPTLPNLRRLDLKAMLDIPYRQRSQIRDKWEAKLKQVFLREIQDPRPAFSLRRQPSATDARGAHNGEPVNTTSGRSRKSGAASRAKAVESPAPRWSNRIATHRRRPSLPASRASTAGRGLRNGRGRPSYAEWDSDTDTDMDGDGDEDGDEDDGTRSGSGSARASTAGEAAVVRQGLCERVEIQLDNQKPAEKTFGMEDFLDEEPDDSLDEEWNGADEDLDVEYAW